MQKQGNRMKVTIHLSMENAAWVAKVAEELDLPVARVVNLCVEGERCSLMGSTARGLAKLINSMVPDEPAPKKSRRGGSVQGKLALEG